MNLAGGQLTVRPKPPAKVVAENAAVEDLPAAVRTIVKVSGVSNDTELAWSWNELEFKDELERAGVQC